LLLAAPVLLVARCSGRAWGGRPGRRAGRFASRRAFLVAPGVSRRAGRFSSRRAFLVAPGVSRRDRGEPSSRIRNEVANLHRK